MALSGQLSDLSLAELIEFFCNQHKTGRLKIAYKKGPGFFYFQNGSLVDSKIGVLSGVEAVYYALTLENASFKFSTAFPPVRRTIHQPWAHVALEGLRRMDEEIKPQEAFPEGDTSYLEEPEYKEDVEEHNKQASAKPKAKAKAASASSNDDSMPLSMMVEEASSPSRGKAIKIGVVAFAVVLLVAAIGVPAGWYKKKSPAPVSTPAQTASQTPPTQTQQQPEQTESSLSTPFEKAQDKKDEATNDAARRALEEERKRAEKERKEKEKKQQEVKNAEQTKPETKTGPKVVTVTVTYDESGKVTSASGGDATALRIARQKRFPPGKGGVATVPIPVN